MNIKNYYKEHLSDINGVRFFNDQPNTESVRQHIVIECEKRDELVTYAAARGVDLQSSYKPLHRFSLFNNSSNIENFPVSERFSQGGIHLPSTPLITKDELSQVVTVIKSFFG